MPEHNQNKLYEQLCVRYKQQSAELQQRHLDEYNKHKESKLREKQLDAEFANKLKSMADESDTLEGELPIMKKK